MYDAKHIISVTALEEEKKSYTLKMVVQDSTQKKKDDHERKLILLEEFTWWTRTVEGVIPGTVFTSIIKTYKIMKVVYE